MASLDRSLYYSFGKPNEILQIFFSQITCNVYAEFYRDLFIKFYNYTHTLHYSCIKQTSKIPSHAIVFLQNTIAYLQLTYIMCVLTDFAHFDLNAINTAIRL